MGELGLNKIFGALLATALGLMGLATLPSVVFGGDGAHHGEHEEAASLGEKMCEQFHHCVEIAEAAPTAPMEGASETGAGVASDAPSTTTFAFFADGSAWGSRGGGNSSSCCGDFLGASGSQYYARSVCYSRVFIRNCATPTPTQMPTPAPTNSGDTRAPTISPTNGFPTAVPTAAG
jgi:hypothetical protein